MSNAEYNNIGFSHHVDFYQVHYNYHRLFTHFLFSLRVIQMIDENKEQLRNLFRNYNVMDVQPATTSSAPEDLSALQV